MTNLRVLSINLSNEKVDTTSNQCPKNILDLFAAQNLSLMMIQEIDPSLIHSIQDFFKTNGLESKYFIVSGTNSMLLSIYPFEISAIFKSSKKTKANVLIGKIKLKNGFETLVGSISIDFNFFNLKDEYQKLKGNLLKIDPEKDLPLILSGNFFDWNQSAFGEYENLLNLKDVFKNFSGEYARNYPASVPVFCLDRMYIRHYSITSCDLLYNNIITTNHLPLLAELKPRP